MATTIDTSIEALSLHLGKSIQKDIERAIKAALMVQAEAVVTQVARDMARSLKAHVRNYRDVDGAVTVQLLIDGVADATQDPGA